MNKILSLTIVLISGLFFINPVLADKDHKHDKPYYGQPYSKDRQDKKYYKEHRKEDKKEHKKEQKQWRKDHKKSEKEWRKERKEEEKKWKKQRHEDEKA